LEQLDLVTQVLFFAPAGEKYLARADRARPLRLFFTDQTKGCSQCGVAAAEAVVETAAAVSVVEADF
jgi:hypothetical protein